MQTLNDGGNDSKENKRKTIFEPKGKFLLRWNKILVVSRVIALFLDPLFFYVPVIDEDNKCIALDKRLWITAIVLRTIDDIIYLTNIVLQFRTAFKDDKHGKELNTDSKAIARRYLKTFFLFDFLAILPIPQVREISNSAKIVGWKKVFFFFFSHLVVICD
jgi:cyclic nucleotide gated channel